MTMWLPTPLYERVPQFWFLLGLLFVASGLYLGFHFPIALAYIAIGFICSTYGVGIAIVRMIYRKSGSAILNPASLLD